jgi:hypothetical protein
MGDDQADLLSDLTDLEGARYFLAELHEELPARVGRFRYMSDLDASLGPSGTIFLAARPLGSLTMKPDRRSSPATSSRQFFFVRA